MSEKNERDRFSEWWHPRVEGFANERDSGLPFWRHPWLAWKERAEIAKSDQSKLIAELAARTEGEIPGNPDPWRVPLPVQTIFERLNARVALIERLSATFEARATKWETEEGSLGAVVAREIRTIIQAFNPTE